MALGAGKLGGAVLGASAIAGFGGSAGRDAYRAAARNAGAAFILGLAGISLAASAVAGYQLTKFHRKKGIIRRLARWTILIPLLVAIGVVLSAFFASFFLPTIFDSGRGRFEITDGVLAFNGYSFVVGAFLGLIRRWFQKRAYAVEALRDDLTAAITAHNVEFLFKSGLEHLRGDQLLSRNGDVLTAEGEPQNGIWEFRVEGQRGKRAYIFLDETDRAYLYSGVIEKSELGRMKLDADVIHDEYRAGLAESLKAAVAASARRSGVSAEFLTKKLPA